MAEFDYDELQRLSDAATPGPWDSDSAVFGYDHKATPYVYPEVGARNICQVYSEAGVADAEFIAVSRSAVPALLARVRELEGERDAALSTIAKVRELHQPSGLRIPRAFGSEPTEACGTCLSTWPCPTARALGSVPSTGEGSNGDS